MTTTENAKLCSYCGELRDPSWFRPQKGKCRACLTSYMRDWRRQLVGEAKEKFLEYKRTWGKAHPRNAEQKAKQAAYMRLKREANPMSAEERAAAAAYLRQWRNNNPEKQKAYIERTLENQREKWFRLGLMRNYKITPAEYRKMEEAQACVCAICSQPNREKGNSRSDVKRRRLHVDHDHATGKIRGLLCGPCNSMLGFVRDDVKILASAIAYLQRERP